MQKVGKLTELECPPVAGEALQDPAGPENGIDQVTVFHNPFVLLLQQLFK
jgi:hypothetical protein